VISCRQPSHLDQEGITASDPFQAKSESLFLEFVSNHCQTICARPKMTA